MYELRVTVIIIIIIVIEVCAVIKNTVSFCLQAVSTSIMYFQCVPSLKCTEITCLIPRPHPLQA